MTNEITTEERLIMSKAKFKIETVGWLQKEWSGKKGYCLFGALEASSNFQVAENLGAKIRHVQNISSLINWNDDPSRTIQDVLQLLSGTNEFDWHKESFGGTSND